MTGGGFRLVLDVPAGAIRMTSSILQSMKDMEACCFWFGHRDERGNGTVEGIIVPRQQNNRGHYHVTADAMVEVANAARAHEWKNLAQVHSHPGVSVCHSGYDDEMANSRRALSLVFPNYGCVPGLWRFNRLLWTAWPGTFPPVIGVHAFIQQKWTLLRPDELPSMLRVSSKPTPTLIDLRP
jgi:hypothetical protein